jgi:hypothetical protein
MEVCPLRFGIRTAADTPRTFCNRVQACGRREIRPAAGVAGRLAPPGDNLPAVRRRWIALAIVPFLLVSFELARFLSSAGVERDRVYKLLVQQARTTPRYRNVRQVKILRYDSKTAYSLGTKTARARVAWADVEDNGLPVVQCVTVTRSWNFVTGASVTLGRLSAPIGNETGC